MTLEIYFARRFLMAFLATFAALAGVLGLIDMLEQIRAFDVAEIGFVEIVRLTLLHLPSSLYEVLPLIAILASIMLFLGLARSSELVVTRAAGRSALRVLVAPVLVATLIGVLAVSVLNPIVAATQKRYDTLADRYRQGGGAALSITDGTLWLRQGGKGEQTVIRAGSADLDGRELRDVTFLGLGEDGGPAWRVTADVARLRPGEWELENAKEWRLDRPDTNPEREAVLSPLLRLPSDLTVERIRDSLGTPSSIPIWDLPGFIRQLEASGFSARMQRVWLQTELALPLLLAAMVMIGAGFTMRHVRLGRTGTMVLLALLTGFGIFFIRNFAQMLGDRGQIPVLLAAWSPPVAAMLLSLGLLLHLEDG